jgi:acetyl esterase
MRNTLRLVILIGLAAWVCFIPTAFGQTRERAAGSTSVNTRRGQTNKPSPTFADVPYGEHERQVLDFWQASSTTPTPVFVWIHGGGFRGGNKSSIPADLLKPFLASGVSCASIHYRLSQHAPYPAQMQDSARAIQFIRSKAKAWKLDPQRMAAGGGSAGSGISQWLAFHDDLAQAQSDDPVARQSTRLCCALPINMQSTYDPRQIKEVVPGDAYKHPALLQLFARPQGWDWDIDPINEELDALLKDASPITHLTKDDPPIYLIHYERANQPGNIHHPNFGKHLKQAMDKLGIECVRKMDSDYESMHAAYAHMLQFVEGSFQN